MAVVRIPAMAKLACDVGGCLYHASVEVDGKGKIPIPDGWLLLQAQGSAADPDRIDLPSGHLCPKHAKDLRVLLRGCQGVDTNSDSKSSKSRVESDSAGGSTGNGGGGSAGP